MKKILCGIILAFSVLQTTDVISSSHAQESLKIAGLSILATTMYGTINGVGVAALFPRFVEQFSLYRGCKETIGGNGKRAGAAFGAICSWWVGPLLALVLMPAARYGVNPLNASDLIIPGLVTLAAAGVCSWGSGGLEYIHQRGGGYGCWENIGNTINSTSYTSGVIGGLSLAAYVWCSRYR